MSDRTRPTYYPRLATEDASRLLLELSELAIEEVADRVDVSFEGVSWYPTAPEGDRVDVQVLQRFRSVVVDLARGFGYPQVPGPKSAKRVAFDRAVVRVISESLDMQPVEAADEQVWNYLSLVIAPDVALWRWPNARQDALYERIIGRPRNVFRRLWWRAFILGGDSGSPGARLHEDEAVAILERTLIGGNAALARVIAQTHLSRFEDRPKRTEVLRDVMKRIRRLHAFMAFHALTRDELQAVASAVFDATESAMFDPRVDIVTEPEVIVGVPQDDDALAEQA